MPTDRHPSDRIPSDRDLLRHIAAASGGRAGYKQLIRELRLAGGRDRRLLREQLARLTKAGQLRSIDTDRWALPEREPAKTARPTRESAPQNARQPARGAETISGRLDLHRDGFGFVRPLDSTNKQQDIFIPPSELASAMQGDQVLVELNPLGRSSDTRRSGRILRILVRNNPTVVGIFHYGTARPSSQGARRVRRQPSRVQPARIANTVPAGFHYLTPLDERMAMPILIAQGDEFPPAPAATPHRVLGAEAVAQESVSPDDLEGLAVNVELTRYPTTTRPGQGRVIEVLGEPDAFGVDVEIVIRKHHLPHVFPAEVLTEAERRSADSISRFASQREDFRNLPIVTIDGETARDFDDAVLVRELPSGNFELQVHIADVAHYVTPGSALDDEARMRGTSVYFPDRAIPMLPQALSSGACSLRPGEDRLVLSAVIEFDPIGNRIGYKLSEGIIRSAARMTYTQVHAILENDPATRARFSALVPEFDRMHRFARILNRRRMERGSIDFDLPEPIIEFDELGAMSGIIHADRNWANRLIEEFMLAANECVASHLEMLNRPSIYRIHERPDPAKIADFEEAAGAFGYTLGIGALPVRRIQAKGDRRTARDRGQRTSKARTHEIPEEILVTPQMYQRLAQRISGKPEERILAFLMLRSLKQAKYSARNEGHFALAAESYTHFTSPIRRYPDLIVHRILKEVFAEIPPTADLSETELTRIATESSDSERRADAAERELIEWKKVRFMQDRIGEEFDATILSVTKYGFFVELNSLFIEGLVPLTSLDTDHFTYRENTRQIMGEHTGERFSIGDPVRVLLDRINTAERRLQFALVAHENAPTHSAARAKSSPKPSPKPPSKPFSRSTPPARRHSRSKTARRERHSKRNRPNK
jgi:ribonuclease R